MQFSKPIKIAAAFTGLLLLILGVASVLSPTFRTQTLGGSGQTILAHIQPTPKQPFPAFNKSLLNPTQRAIVEISRQEYAKKPVSFDATVLKYSQGTKESWCADYVSWVLKQANRPLNNPNSGSWRIPGTATMQEYYKQAEQYVPASASFKPAVGDVAIYRDHRSHVNIVVAVHGDTMTTIGGNETGHIRLNTQKYTYGSQGLSGFGLTISLHGTRDSTDAIDII